MIDFAEYGAEGFAFQTDRTLANWTPVVVQLHAPLALLAENVGWPEPGSAFAEVGSFMEGFSIRRADALMACSANIADFAAERYGVERSEIDVVYSGVDAAAFAPGPKPEGPPTVLYVGNIAPSKGVETLVEAVLRLGPEVRLLVAGERNALADTLAQRAPGVEFLGFVARDDLPALYRAADVFCSPAQHEGGVANVFVEAMACARPVVASTAGGGPEAVLDGETGLLVPPGDVDAVAGALARLFGDRGLAARMGEAGRRRVEEVFAMDRYIERVLAVYERAVERSLRSRDHQRAREWA